MSSRKTEILVFAHWLNMASPVRMGILTALEVRGHLTWSFVYDDQWLETQTSRLLDPDLQWYSGPQYAPIKKPNFGIFLDSMPDTWGRTLMQKREVYFKHPDENRTRLTDLNYLLGVYDAARMGGLRFKLEEQGPFLDDNQASSIPPLTDIRELQAGAEGIESDEDSEEVRKWLRILLAPGSSLGGARPKASVKDERGELWIAKFPSRNDTTDIGAWEYVAWKLAKNAGINVSDARIEHVSGRYHTFFTKRFDRTGVERIHFDSAMTMTGHVKSEILDSAPSYLELAEFIQYYGVNPKADLEQLWRRIVFNICISNTDDHLRNHGFLLMDEGWRLSPAYDLNPTVNKSGLALNIDLHNNDLDFDLARSVGGYFDLNHRQMDKITGEVQDSVGEWKQIATSLGISTGQIRLMESAFLK